MIHAVPWHVLSGDEVRAGLVTLAERMDLGMPGDRPRLAYVALRMISTRAQSERPETDMEIELSPAATVALVEELATMPLGDLREILLTTLRDAEEARTNENQRTQRPNRPTVRKSRTFRFQR